MKILVSLILSLLAVVIFSSPASAGPTDKELYDRSCKTCHGVDGKGNKNLAEKVLKIKPECLDLTKQATKDKKDEALKVAITDGIGKMKGLKDKLKADEIAPIVAHVRTLQK
ncbi:MAG: cytochrome c [bacterium]|nr:cytochrome c [bacterium]